MAPETERMDLRALLAVASQAEYDKAPLTVVIQPVSIAAIMVWAARPFFETREVVLLEGAEGIQAFIDDCQTPLCLTLLPRSHRAWDWVTQTLLHSCLHAEQYHDHGHPSATGQEGTSDARPDRVTASSQIVEGRTAATS